MILISFIEPLWLALSLTLTGGLLVAFGVKNQHLLPRLTGVLLQIFSLYIFSSLVWYPFSGSLGRNYYFLSCLLFTVTAFGSAYFIEKHLIGGMRLSDRVCFWSLCILGILSWYVGAIREVYAHIVLFERLSGILLIVSITSILVGLVSENSDWKTLNSFLLLQLPAMVAVLLYHHFTEGHRFSMLTGWGTTVWPITFFIGYRALAVIDDSHSRIIGRIYHITSLWLLFYFCNLEIGFAVEGLRPAHSLIIVLARPLFALAVIFLVVIMKKINIWPVRMFPKAYLWAGNIGIIVISIFSLSLQGP